MSFPHKPYRRNPSANRRDWFSRSTLELTFQLLRRPSPGLALTVRNAMLSEPGSVSAYPVEEIPLSPETVASVVNTLRRYCAIGYSQGDRLLAQSLLWDWQMALNAMRDAT